MLYQECKLSLHGLVLEWRGRLDAAKEDLTWRLDRISAHTTSEGLEGDIWVSICLVFSGGDNWRLFRDSIWIWIGRIQVKAHVGQVDMISILELHSFWVWLCGSLIKSDLAISSVMKLDVFAKIQVACTLWETRLQVSCWVFWKLLAWRSPMLGIQVRNDPCGHQLEVLEYGMPI